MEELHEIIKEFLSFQHKDKEVFKVKERSYSYQNDNKIIYVFAEYFCFCNEILIEESHFDNDKNIKNELSILHDLNRFIETEEDENLVKKIKITKNLRRF